VAPDPAATLTREERARAHALAPAPLFSLSLSGLANKPKRNWGARLLAIAEAVGLVLPARAAHDEVGPRNARIPSSLGPVALPLLPLSLQRTFALFGSFFFWRWGPRMRRVGPVYDNYKQCTTTEV